MLTDALLTVLLLAGQVDVKPAVAIEAQVQRLVAQLNADQAAQRDEAEQALAALGPPALAFLPQPTDRTPAEVIQRLARVRQKLEQAQAKAAGKSSMVTIKVARQPLSDVLKELAKQSGNPIIDHRGEFGDQPSDPKITLDLKNVPFWQALDAVLDQAQLTVYNFAGKPGIYLITRPGGQGPRSGAASYSGPFRIEPVRFEAVKDLQRKEGPQGSVRLFLDITWEPRIAPIAVGQPIADVSATGDGSQAIAPLSAESEGEAPVTEAVANVELQIPFSLPDRSIKKIATLNGKLHALVPAQTEAFRFEKLSTRKATQTKRPKLHKAGVTVALERFRKNNELWTAELRVHFDHPETAIESHRGWIFNNEAFLLDLKGQRIPQAGLEKTAETENEVGVQYLFDVEGNPEGYTLVYRTPTAILDVSVEYQLRDLPLP